MSVKKRKLKHKTEMVYDVFPLPDAMLNFLWNYDQLDDENLRQLTAMVLHYYNEQYWKQRGVLSEPIWRKNEIAQISTCIFNSHRFIRERQNSWSQSLRDINRFRILLFWVFEQI